MSKPVRRIPGLIFFVTTNLADRSEKIFRERDLAEVVRTCLFAFCGELAYSVYAWVVMPDHWHAIIGLKGDKTISQVMNRIKGVAA
jgi:REP element-mobilizing transposase RayT